MKANKDLIVTMNSVARFNDLTALAATLRESYEFKTALIKGGFFAHFEDQSDVCPSKMELKIVAFVLEKPIDHVNSVPYGAVSMVVEMEDNYVVEEAIIVHFVCDPMGFAELKIGTISHYMDFDDYELQNYCSNNCVILSKSTGKERLYETFHGVVSKATEIAANGQLVSF